MRPVYSADVFAVLAAIFPYAKPQLGFFEPGSRLFDAPGAAGISRKKQVHFVSLWETAWACGRKRCIFVSRYVPYSF